MDDLERAFVATSVLPLPLPLYIPVPILKRHKLCMKPEAPVNY